jgi:uncharacterized protein
VGKILLIIFALLLVYWIIKSGLRRGAARGDKRTASGRSEDMVRCAHCGVHLPRSDSLMLRDEYFCCIEHQHQHQSGA